MIDLREQYGKRYKVERCKCGGDHPGDDLKWFEIAGKRGYIRLWDYNENAPDALEMYLTSVILANKVEREYPAFKAKNHYDDAIAFTFRNDPALMALACKWIRAKNRKQFSPEQLAAMRQRLANLRKPGENSGLADEHPAL